jgi:hypothetical protein
MLAKRRKSLRSKVKAFRKRKLRKEWDDTDEEIMSLATGQPDDKGN